MWAWRSKRRLGDTPKIPVQSSVYPLVTLSEAQADDFVARGLHQNAGNIHLVHGRTYTEHNEGVDQTELTKIEFADLTIRFACYFFKCDVRVPVQPSQTGRARSASACFSIETEIMWCGSASFEELGYAWQRRATRSFNSSSAF
jgi:hypothetical protein